MCVCMCMRADKQRIHGRAQRNEASVRERERTKNQERREFRSMTYFQVVIPLECVPCFGTVREHMFVCVAFACVQMCTGTMRYVVAWQWCLSYYLLLHSIHTARLGTTSMYYTLLSVWWNVKHLIFPSFPSLHSTHPHPISQHKLWCDWLSVVRFRRGGLVDPIAIVVSFACFVHLL